MDVAFIVVFSVLGIGLLFCVYMMARNTQVYRLRIKLLDEEWRWLDNNPTTRFVGFRRYDSLPSYDKMLTLFWKRVSSFEKALKPIESYYQDVLVR